MDPMGRFQVLINSVSGRIFVRSQMERWSKGCYNGKHEWYLLRSRRYLWGLKSVKKRMTDEGDWTTGWSERERVEPSEGTIS